MAYLKSADSSSDMSATSGSFGLPQESSIFSPSYYELEAPEADDNVYSLLTARTLHDSRLGETSVTNTPSSHNSRLDDTPSSHSMSPNSGKTSATPYNALLDDTPDPSNTSLTAAEKRKAATAAVDSSSSNDEKPPKGAKQGKSSSTTGKKKNPREWMTKRKEQNRAAQRAFRERKEKHLKDLEDRIDQLEAESTNALTENKKLKSQVAKLQTDLKKYRRSQAFDTGGAPGKLARTDVSAKAPSSKFTFNFPMYGTNKLRKESFSSSTSEQKQSDFGDLMTPSSSALTPVSSFGEASKASTSPILKKPSAIDEQEGFCDELSSACGTREHPVPKYTRPAISADKKPPSFEATVQNTFDGRRFSHHEFVKPRHPLDQQPSVKIEDSAASSVAMSPPAFELDFLSEYRDPIFEQDRDFHMPELTTEASMFDPLELFPATAADVSSQHPQQNLDGPDSPVTPGGNDDNHHQVDDSANVDDDDYDDGIIVPAGPEYVPCKDIWDRITANPRYKDFDLLSLCDELKTKAKCSEEEGVLVSQHDVSVVVKRWYGRVVNGFA